MQTNATLQEQLILEHIKKLERAEKSFLPFVRHVWPEFISGYHHRKIAKKFEEFFWWKFRINAIIFTSNRWEFKSDREKYRIRWNRKLFWRLMPVARSIAPPARASLGGLGATWRTPKAYASASRRRRKIKPWLVEQDVSSSAWRVIRCPGKSSAERPATFC